LHAIVAVTAALSVVSRQFRNGQRLKTTADA
jgi:hypothetical protein